MKWFSLLAAMSLLATGCVTFQNNGYVDPSAATWQAHQDQVEEEQQKKLALQDKLLADIQKDGCKKAEAAYHEFQRAGFFGHALAVITGLGLGSALAISTGIGGAAAGTFTYAMGLGGLVGGFSLIEMQYWFAPANVSGAQDEYDKCLKSKAAVPVTAK